MDPKKESWTIFLLSLIIFGTLSGILSYLPAPYVDYLEAVDQDTVGAILSATSILFGLLVGFFISQMWQKFSKIRDYNAEFEACFIELIRLVNHLDIDQSTKEKFKSCMEEYLVVWITLPWHYADKDEKYFKKLHDVLDKVEIEGQKNMLLYKELLSCLSRGTKARKKLAVLGKQKLLHLEWTILILLTLMIIISTFLLREESTHSLLNFSNFVSSVLPSIAILAMLIIRDLDNLRWNITHVSFEPAERLFDELNVQRFYEKDALENLDIKIPDDKKYRTEDDLEGKVKKVYKEIEEKGWNKYKEQY